LSTLRSVSLIRLSGDEVFLHQIIMQLVLDDWISTEGGPEAARAMTDVATNALAALMTVNLGNTYAHWSRLEPLVVHAESVLAHADRFKLESAATGRLRFWLATYLFDRGRRADSRRLYSDALDSQRRVLGDDHADTIASMNALSRTLRNDGSVADFAAALRLSNEALDRARRHLGDSHRETVRAAIGVALSHRHAGDHQTASEWGRWAVARAQATFGADDPDTCEFMNDLGLILRVMGHIDEAIELERASLRGLEAAPGYGPGHPLALSTVNNLAFALRDRADNETRDLEEARALNERLYQTRLANLGPDHPSTLLAYNNLALVYRDQGDLATALRIHEHVVRVRQATEQADSRRVLISQSHIGQVLFRMGELERADEILTHVLDMRRRHAATAQTTLEVMVHVADVALARRDYPRARALYQEALDARMAQLGEASRDTATAMFGLASVLAAEGDVTESRRLHERALQVRRALLGERHRETQESAAAVRELDAMDHA
jgi:tetratricopeptide (TPR) repeat protein